MNICIEFSELALSDTYGSFKVGGWYRLPFQYTDLSLKRSDKTACSVRHLDDSRYAIIARVDQVVTTDNDVQSEHGQLVVISLEQQNLYFFCDYWDMYDQKFREYKPGEYIEGELSLYLDAGLMRPFEYGLYKQIPEASRNGFYIVKIARILEVTQNGSKIIKAIDAETARERQSDYIIECEAGNPSGNFIRDDLTMKTLDFYIERRVEEPTRILK